jgi:hypothetical protein
MACVLTRVFGDPEVDMKGDSAAKVTLKLVPTRGKALFESSSYDGQSLISGATDELTFTIKDGVKTLSVVCTFSSTDGAAELREKCDGNTLLDGNVTAVNNGKLYHVRGTATGGDR